MNSIQVKSFDGKMITLKVKSIKKSTGFNEKKVTVYELENGTYVILSEK